MLGGSVTGAFFEWLMFPLPAVVIKIPFGIGLISSLRGQPRLHCAIGVSKAPLSLAFGVSQYKGWILRQSPRLSFNGLTQCSCWPIINNQASATPIRRIWRLLPIGKIGWEPEQGVSISMLSTTLNSFSVLLLPNIWVSKLHLASNHHLTCEWWPAIIAENFFIANINPPRSELLTTCVIKPKMIYYCVQRAKK